MLFTLVLMADPAHAFEPPAQVEQAELAALAKRQTTTAVLEIAGGAVAVGSGLALMTVGRRPGEISREGQGASDLRTMSGIGLLLAGLTTAIIGGNTLTQAAVTRERAANLTVGLSADPVREGMSLHFRGVF